MKSLLWLLSYIMVVTVVHHVGPYLKRDAQLTEKIDLEKEILETQSMLRRNFCLVGFSIFISCEAYSLLAAAAVVLLLVLLGCILPNIYRKTVGCDIKWRVYGITAVIATAVGIPLILLCGSVWGMLIGLSWIVGLAVIGIAMPYNKLHELQFARIVFQEMADSHRHL